MGRHPEPEGIAFYGGPFSNFAHSPIWLPHPFLAIAAEEFQYTTAEHRFQAMKAAKRHEHDWIGTRPSPAGAKMAGRHCDLRPDWEDVKFEIMIEALRAKFALEEFQEVLLDTGDQLIWEDSPTDAEWGLWDKNKRDFTGKNLLGKALMLVREEYRIT